MAFLKLVLELLTNVHNTCHIHFVESGEHCGSILGFYKSAANGLAQVTHLLATLIATVELLTFKCLFAWILQRVQYIMLQYSSIRAGRFYSSRIYFFVGQNSRCKGSSFYI